MGSGHSIHFRSGPYRRWGVTVDEINPSTLVVQVEAPPRPGRVVGLSGVVYLNDSYDLFGPAVDALIGGPAELAVLLRAILDATEAALPGTPDRRQRYHWARIVAEAYASRDMFDRMWPDGNEPAFQVVATDDEQAEQEQAYALSYGSALARILRTVRA